MEKNQPVNESPIVVSENKKKIQKGTIIGMSALGILAIAGIAFGVYGMVSRKQRISDLEAQIANCATNTDKVTTVTCPDGTEVSTTATNMATEYKEVTATLESLTSNIEKMHAYVEYSDNLAYKASGANTFVPIKFSIKKETSSYDDNSEAAKDLATLKANLTNAGFSSIGIIPFRGSAGPQIDGYLNSETNTICGVISDSHYYDDVAHDYIILECAKTNWTWLTKEDETLIKAFETAYYNKTGSYPYIMTSWNNQIKNSEYKPYQNVWVGIGGGAGLFYRTSPDAEWQFFTGTQGLLECGDFNTDDLKKAYLGEQCWDNGQSTVQL